MAPIMRSPAGSSRGVPPPSSAPGGRCSSAISTSIAASPAPSWSAIRSAASRCPAAEPRRAAGNTCRTSCSRGWWRKTPCGADSPRKMKLTETGAIPLSRNDSVYQGGTRRPRRVFRRQSSKPARDGGLHRLAPRLLWEEPGSLHRYGLADLAGGVLENDVGEHGGVRFVRQVRTEADADVEGLVDVQVDGWAELVHGLAFQADEEREGVAMLFDANAPGHDADKAVRAGAAGPAASSDAKFQALDPGALRRTLRQVDHAETVHGGDGLLGIVIEVLANDEDRLAVAKTVRVRIHDVGRE